MQEVVVTGVGVVTSHAENAGGFLNAVTKGISGIRKSGILSQYGYATEYCGLIDKDPSERWEEKFHRIGTQAIRELLDDAQIRPDEIRSLGSRTAYFLASASLGSLRMERLLKKRATQGEDLYEEKALDGNSSDCCFYFKEQLGIQGPVFKVDVACASGTVAIGEAVQLIQAGAADLCVSSGIDVLNDLTLSGFNSMNNMDPEPCRPFDQSHNGITIGEGAGFVLLESLQHAKERGAKIYGRITGYVSGNDAYHVTAPDPSGDGAFYCMNEVLRQWGKTPEQIYINTHGTATRQNDEMEMLAIERYAHCIKNISYNEPWVPGHYPDRPVFPGVLLVEALGQASGPMFVHPDETRQYTGYLTKIEQAKFIRPVVPGDQVLLETNLESRVGDYFQVRAVAKVDGRKVATCRLSIVLKEGTTP